MLGKLRTQTLFSVYLLGFIFAFHVALSTYINSSFLSVFMPENWVGIIYTSGSLLTIVLFFIFPLFLKKIGNYRLTLLLIILEMFALAGLVIFESFFWLTTSFLTSFITISLIYLSLDVFLEGFSSDKVTGRIRGLYLTIVNLGWIFAPMISGLILSSGDYWKIYAASFILLIPGLFILFGGLKKFKDPIYPVLPVWHTAKEIVSNRDLRNIFGSHFLLNFFYSLMIIYTPIYLNKYVNFSWEQIGLIFGIMLLPFVFIQFPLGQLSDKRFGEKEILSVGFIITAISTATLAFLPLNTGLWLWAFLLFMTRVGASAIEVMSDTYFFKKVNNSNSDIISMFRTSRPLAYIVAPLLITTLINISKLELKYVFLVLGLIMFLGLKFSLSIKDTK